MSVLDSSVLVLNRLYQPVNVTTVRRAFSLLYQGVAKAILFTIRRSILGDFRLHRPIWLALLVEGANTFARFGRSTRLHMMLQCALEIVFY